MLCVVALGPVGGHGVLLRSASILCPKASKSIVVKPPGITESGVMRDRASIKRVKNECWMAGRWSGVAAERDRIPDALRASANNELRFGSRWAYWGCIPFKSETAAKVRNVKMKSGQPLVKPPPSNPDSNSSIRRMADV